MAEGQEGQVEIMVSRNDLCPCGSGKKYKFCCGNSTRKTLNHAGLNRAFLFVVNSICTREKAKSITIPSDDLDSLPKDMVLALGYNPKKDVFIFKPVIIEKKAIITPDRRIIV